VWADLLGQTYVSAPIKSELKFLFGIRNKIHMGASDNNHSPSHPERARLINQVVNIGLLCNIFLAVLKISVAVIGHSRALLADGVNSCSDVAYYIVVKIFTNLAGKPADKEYPYGHHQMESIAAM
jgi:Co/Zn/Cd efflux system component